MRELAVRLKRGSDLRKSIETVCRENAVDTAVVLSGVGSVSTIRIRLAKALDHLEKTGNFEIVSLTGTISKGKAHVHIGVSDEQGRCYGGHLQEGCEVDTTCELVLGILEEYASDRKFDEETGFAEILFKQK